MQSGRYYEIEADDEDVHLSMMFEGVQVGGAVFPLDRCPGAIVLAEQMGEAYQNNSAGHSIH